MDRRLDLATETGTIQPTAISKENLTMQRARFNRQKRKYAWLEHHSVYTKDRGRCRWEQCPGRKRITKKQNDHMIPSINVFNVL